MKPDTQNDSFSFLHPKDFYFSYITANITSLVTKEAHTSALQVPVYTVTMETVADQCMHVNINVICDN